jgi:hypothetical protein
LETLAFDLSFSQFNFAVVQSGFYRHGRAFRGPALAPDSLAIGAAFVGKFFGM